MVCGKDESKLTTLKFNANDGEPIPLSEIDTITAPWLSQKRCVLHGARLVCRHSGSLHSVNLNSLGSSYASLPIGTEDEHFVEFLQSKELLVQTAPTHLTIYDIGNDRITPVKEISIEFPLVSVTEFDQHLILSTTKLDKTGILWYSLKEGKFLEEKTFRSCLGDEISSISQLIGVPKTKNDRLLVVGGDDSFSLALKSGEILWSRQEALASIVSVELLDLPLSEAQADIEKEFTAQAGMIIHSQRISFLSDLIRFQYFLDNIVGMFFKRILSQAVQIKHAASRLSETFYTTVMSTVNSVLNGESITASFFGKSEKSQVKSQLERDYFNLHKMIVAVASVGKVGCSR